MKPALLVGCVSLIVIGASSPEPFPQQRPVFVAATDHVAIDVSVRRGKTPVTNLTAIDFALSDNGIGQHVDIASEASVPLDVTLVVDESAYGSERLNERFASDFTAILQLLNAGDRLQLIAFAAYVREAVAMQTVSEWRSQLADPQRPPALSPGGGRSGTGPIGRLALERMADPALSHSSLIDALTLAVANPVETGRRHLVFAFAGGTDDTSVHRFTHRFEAIAARSDAFVDVALWNRRGEAFPLGVGAHFLRLTLAAAATATGGDLRDASDPLSALKSVLADFRQRYLLTYTLTGVPPGGWHTVEVKVPKFPGYEIRARKGYLGR